MTAHAKLSASGAHRWMACPPSVALEQNYPDQGSVFAAEGTLAHEVAELKLRAYAIEPMSKSAFNSRFGELKKHELWQAEMDEHTDRYLDYIKGVILSYSVQPFVAAEKKVDFSKYVPGGFGTADCLVLAGNVLHVIDFKYGKGVEVSAVDNPQMMLYALGALNAYALLYKFDIVKMAIVQPRINNISEFELTADELISWGENVVAPKAKLAAEGKGEYNPGDHCRFCRAKAECRARAEKCMELLPVAQQWEEDSKKAVTKVAGLYGESELSEYLKAGKLLKAWYEDIQDYALGLCLNGHDVPGFKAVEGRGSRAFTDQDAAFDTLMANGVDKAMLYEYVPLSLAQAEKVVGKKRFGELMADFIMTRPGKPTLVPESDRRKAITNAVTAADVFKNMEE